MTQPKGAPRLLLLLYMLLETAKATDPAQIVCYDCYGNSSTAGQFCSIDSLCTGSSCYFQVDPSGSWSSGCSWNYSPSTLSCALSSADETRCTCSADFCNQFEDVNTTIHNFWPARAPFSTLQLAWPQSPMIMCQECGNLTIGGLVRDIPCDEVHLCQGNYCVTKRGQTPHSYCGSSWQGSGQVACFKNPGEDEQCVCPQQMCNAVLPPAKTSSPGPTTVQTAPTSLATILTTATPALDPGDPPVTTQKPPTKICQKGIKFSPNSQAVLMGEKLKNIILGGFGTGGQAIEQFTDDIDTHICAYSP